MKKSLSIPFALIFVFLSFAGCSDYYDVVEERDGVVYAVSDIYIESLDDMSSAISQIGFMILQITEEYKNAKKIEVKIMLFVDNDPGYVQELPYVLDRRAILFYNESRKNKELVYEHVRLYLNRN